MKYSIIFAATAAASYDAYGNYGEVKSSSVIKSSSTSKPVGYTTIYPGYGKQPVTVTTQYQPYPTCVSSGDDAKSCDKWEDDSYVSTTIKDCDGNYKVITNTNEPVTVYHTKKTITHSAKYGYPTSSAGYAAPTGAAYKNGTSSAWYELYEKIEEVPYNKLGPHALPGYSGSGLYPEGDKKQPVLVKEYKGGKWSQYEHEYKYGVPKDEVKTYKKPGVYTLPAKNVYVDKPVTQPAEATQTAKAGETCTYGGAYVDAKQTGYVTGAFGAYQTSVVGDKTVTETVVKYITIYVTSTGKVEIAKPTTTVYDHDTEIAYPTAKSYEAGVYHQDAKVITITKSGEEYTCKYEATPTPKKSSEHPAYPTSTLAYENSYGYKPSATPKKPEAYPSYTAYPLKGNVTYGHGHGHGKPTSAISGKPYATGYGYAKSSSIAAKSTPVYEQKKHSSQYSASKASSTPCKSSSTKAPPTPYKATPVYENAYPSATPAKPSVYKEKHYSQYSAVKASSTPCESNKYPAATPTPYKSTPVYENVYPSATPSVYEEKPYGSAKPSPTPAKDAAYGASYKRSRVARALAL